MDKQKKQTAQLRIIGLLVIVVSVIATAFISWALYNHTVNILTENIREKLAAIVSTGAVQFDAEDIKVLQVEEDYKKPEWKKVVTQLRKIRENNGKIIFAYLLRKSATDPQKIEFVADSHSMNPYANTDSDPRNDVDVDLSGVIDETDKLQWPGQEYEDPPPEVFEGFSRILTNEELYQDEYGVFITGYAPIYDKNHNPVAVLGVDIEASDFLTLTTQTLYPFLSFILGLIGVILILAYCLIKCWNRQVELVMELDRQKDELMSIVRHQLAAPVTSLRWDTELLLGGDVGKLTAPQKEHVTAMYAIVTNLVDLVEMVSEVSRVRLGLTKVEREKVDLAALFKDIMAVIQPRITEKQIRFVQNLPSSFPEAFIDRRLTRMPIENFLTNAVKYTPKKGKVTLTVTICNGALHCEVTDTGCGIPKAEQKEIFGRLFRASNARESFEGNGLGLYVAKGAIEAQGGTICFTSEEGKGSTFAFVLPLHNPHG